MRALRVYWAAMPRLPDLRIPIRGTSMLPVLREGDEVSVRPARIYWPGQVLVFLDPHGQVWVHRLLGAKPSGNGWRLFLKGDAASKLDPPVETGRVLGRVVAVRRDGADRPLDRTDNFLRWMRSLQEYIRGR